MTKQAQPPDRKKVLFEFLFNQGREEALIRLSSGIQEIIGNASNLLDEADILASANRYDRATFLVATAEEEFGKLYILIDMCRVNFARHEVLLRLCGVFYSNMIKRTYLDYSSTCYPGITTMADLKHYVDLAKIKWWPGSPEDGDPDMPHETFFLREAKLYVDVDDYADCWVSPDESSRVQWRGGVSGFSPTPIEDARKKLDTLKRTRDEEFFATNVLSIINYFMKRLSLTEKTSTDVITACYEKIGHKLNTECGIDVSRFIASELHNWPLYWIV